MKKKYFYWIMIIVLLLAGLPGCGQPTASPAAPTTAAPAATTPGAAAGPKDLILATTTSTQDTGLLDLLVPLFETQSGFKVKTVAVGSGQAMKMGEEGNADVLLVHSPAAEKTFMDNKFGQERTLVMHNDFVFVGPKDDPAGVKKATKAIDALKLISDKGSPFVSRADNSGTNTKELDLWKKASVDPKGKAWYIESGQGMAASLKIASEKAAYTLTDRGTWLATMKSLNLDIVLEKDPALLNIYHVITLNPEKSPKANLAGAQAFAKFITSAEIQKKIGEFGVDKYGSPLFFPDAGKKDEDVGK